MARMVQCVVMKREAEGLESAPHPGALGLRIYEQVSQEGWAKWLERLAMIMNENSISTADPKSAAAIEAHMLGFFFGEGEAGGTPAGFKPGGGGGGKK